MTRDFGSFEKPFNVVMFNETWNVEQLNIVKIFAFRPYKVTSYVKPSSHAKTNNA